MSIFSVYYTNFVLILNLSLWRDFVELNIWWPVSTAWSDTDYPAAEKGSMRSFPASPTRGGSGQRPVLNVSIAQETEYSVVFCLPAWGGADMWVVIWCILGWAGKLKETLILNVPSISVEKEKSPRLKWSLFIDYSFRFFDNDDQDVEVAAGAILYTISNFFAPCIDSFIIQTLHICRLYTEARF